MKVGPFDPLNRSGKKQQIITKLAGKKKLGWRVATVEKSKESWSRKWRGIQSSSKPLPPEEITYLMR
jgi:hypothetical protein